ncbi:MAG: ATP-binding protein [Planctomycetes bacterium]|nr:ATP-binding protein [Planctomycetota bacterium]
MATTQQTWTLKSIASLLSQRVGLPEDKSAKLIDTITLFISQAINANREVVIDDFAKLKLNPTSQTENIKPLLIPTNEVISPIARALSINVNITKKAITSYFAIVKEKIINNDRLKIDRFLALKITEEKARIIDDPISGQKTISPSKKVISYMSHPKFKQATGGKEFQFIPSVSLKEGVEAIKTSVILLAIPDEDFFTDTLKYHFNKEGWKIQIAKNMDDAFDIINAGKAYLAIVDSTMPDYLRLCEKIKITRSTSLIPLIVLLPTGADINKATEFRVQGNEQLAQPFEVKKLLSISEAELQRASEEQIIFDQEIQFQFPTTDDNIDRANEMAASIFANSGLNDEGQVALSAAFREGVGNAAQHGNRYRRDKIINVMYLLDKEKITLIIEDQGNGFDWRLYVDDAKGSRAVEKARRRHQQGKLGGLGIMLMTRCTDKVEYNEKGNTLTLYKGLVSTEE